MLLVNLGTPSAPTRAAVRAFLAEFLADPAVVDLNRVLWWIVRNAIILPLRSGRVARQYRGIWTRQGSPLLAEGERLKRRLETELGPGYRVFLAMRYGEPSLARGMEEIAAAGCARAVAVPLFPQYSRTTTGTIEDAIERVRGRLGLGLRLASPCYEEPLYVQALVERVRDAMAEGPWDHLVLSFHGLPERYVADGDPYRAHCEATAHALAAELGLAPADWSLVWQSRFGREEWLKPYADVLVPRLATAKKRVVVVCPGFAADCLETLEEIGVRLRAAFLEAGGEELRLAPCLNDHPTWVRSIAAQVRAMEAP